MISGFNEEDFRQELQKYFTPAQPISKPEHLYGRQAKLTAISRAISSPGKHIFIYGDRGVGKTSLAKTAFQIQRSEQSHIPIVACEGSSQFFDLVDSMRRQIVFHDESVSSKSINLLHSYSIKPSVVPPTMRSINDAVEALRASVKNDGPPTLIIVDEFDQLQDEKDKKSFADLIKQLSDQEINLRLIICGIGRSLEELIGVHLSTDRYLSTVPLQQIPHDARWKIIEAASKRFQIEIDRDSIIRIGQISDGFPYYVHLMGEKIFWEIFDDDALADRMTMKHYQGGIASAIEESQTSLRQAYEIATQKHSNSEDYEEVLWSVADGTILSRQTTEIYEKSYIEIMSQRSSRRQLNKDIFYQRMNRLKHFSHGIIVVGNKQGWYGFKENVVRGYVRLRAERAGVRIGIDHIKYEKI